MRFKKEKMFEMMKKASNSRWGIIVQFLLIGLWGAQLLNTDAYYVNYALLLMITAICCYHNLKAGKPVSAEKTGLGKARGRYHDVVMNIFAALFSCMVAFANYKIWSFAEMPEDYCELPG